MQKNESHARRLMEDDRVSSACLQFLNGLSTASTQRSGWWRWGGACSMCHLSSPACCLPQKLHAHDQLRPDRVNQLRCLQSCLQRKNILVGPSLQQSATLYGMQYNASACVRDAVLCIRSTLCQRTAPDTLNLGFRMTNTCKRMVRSNKEASNHEMARRADHAAV